MSIGNRIKEERERLKLSQTAFGDIGGMGKTTVQSWERGTAFPNAAFLSLAAMLGIDVYYVITGERLENTATTPNELAYLRACRRMPDESTRTAGRETLIAILNAHGVSMTDESADMPIVKQINMAAGVYTIHEDRPGYNDALKNNKEKQ